MTSGYPKDCIQILAKEWWIKAADSLIVPGRLLWAIVPHVDAIPYTLIPEGRVDDTDHNTARFKLGPLRISARPSLPRIPVAALPQFENETYTVHRSKKRPVLVCGSETDLVPRKLVAGSPKSQTNRTILVAPYYGGTANAKRSGWRPEFVKRIRQGEYRQYFWDMLPITGTTPESILRLDHLQPIGMHHDCYELTDYRLSDEAMIVLRERLLWMLEGKVPEGGLLELFLEDNAP